MTVSSLQAELPAPLPRRRPFGSAVVMAVDLDDVREIALSLPRTEEHLIRQYVKFRVGRIVYASVSPDEEIMGFGYPREERDELLAAEPEKFLPPLPSDESGTSGCGCGWPRSTRPSCANCSSTPGGWWCPSAWHASTASTDRDAGRRDP
jgi:hypothetical protein